jgi:hypothetical protein
MTNNQKLMIFLAKLFIWCAPITAFPFFKTLLREASGEGLVYAIILSTPLILLTGFGGPLIIIKPVKILGYLFLFSILSILLNLSHLDLITMGRSGLSRFSSQMVSFIFVIYAMIIMSNIFIRIPLKKLLSIILTGFYIQIAIIYIQLLVFFVNIDFVTKIYVDIFSILINKDILLESLGRPHGISQEPSHAAIFFILSWPIYLFKNKLLSLKGIFVILALLSMLSRSLVIILIIQSITFFFVLSRNKGKITPYISVILFLLLLFFIFGDFITSAIDIENSGSTLTRFVAIYSAFKVFLNYPLFGVGFGLTSYFSGQFFSDFGLVSNEIIDVHNGVRLPFIHNFYFRLLSDLGGIGLSLWFWLVLSQARLYKKIDKSSVYRPIIITLGISFPFIFLTKENVTFMNLWLFTVVFYCIYLLINKSVKI